MVKYSALLLIQYFRVCDRGEDHAVSEHVAIFAGSCTDALSERSREVAWALKADADADVGDR